ncbi:hypothetical protein ACFVSW_26215 [Neobacillus sp. NPDC058068]|uniref:hypothetical protein n=1 Tax=Neobacillus sp. NPDC058068 TaxID=3346325 RepID=UPI0036D99627
MEINRIVFGFKIMGIEGKKDILIDRIKSLFEVQRFYSDQLITLFENSDEQVKVVLKGSSNIDFDIINWKNIDLIQNFATNSMFDDFVPNLNNIRFSFESITFNDGFNKLFISELPEEVKTEMLGFKVKIDNNNFYVTVMNKNKPLNLSITLKINKDNPIKIGEDIEYINTLLKEKVIPTVNKVIGWGEEI